MINTENRISDRMQPLHPSTIREMIKYVQLPGVISFAAGGPSAECFPLEELRRLSDEIYTDVGAGAFAYGATEGYTPLRETLKKRMREKYNAGADYDDLIIGTGGQQTIDLAYKCLTNEGDTIICEQPSFIGALNGARGYRLNIVGVPMDNNGMIMEELEAALKREKNVKLIYTIPDYQNPMGVSMSLERRKRLLELAREFDVMVIEDNPYFELRYSGEHIPLIKSLDTEGRVIFAGSVSKIIAPAMRVGFCIAEKYLISKMTVAKQVADVHTNSFAQILADRFLTRCDVDAHIERCRDVYRAKRDRMLKRMEETFPDNVPFTRPNGGLFIWAQMPAGNSGSEFIPFAADRGVACVPGSTFDVAEDKMNSGVRLNFSVPSFEQIDKGVDIVADCLKKFIK